jgi:hypothetical protein
MRKDAIERGYAFALPRLVARLAGRRARQAELSRWEAYGLGILVFGISWVFTARLILAFVRQGVLRGFILVLLLFAVWIAYLLLYFVNAQIVALLRKLGLYSAPANNPFQHFVIMSGTTLFALRFLRDECDWVNLLGVFWLGLLALNLLSIVVLKIRHDP